MLNRLEGAFKAAVVFLLGLLFGSNKPPNFSPRHISRILVIRQHNQLGDMLCAVPLLRSLRTAYPHALTTLLTSPVNHEVMVGNRCVDEVINYDKGMFIGRGFPRVGKLIAFVRRLRRKQFDLVIVPATVSMSFTSDLLAFCSGARFRAGAKTLEGIANPSGFVYNMSVDLNWRLDPRRHQTLRNADVAERVCPLPTNLSSEITLSTSELESGRAYVGRVKGEHRMVVAFHPGAGKVRNRWAADRFATVARTFSEEFDATVLITRGPMDDDPVLEMLSHLKTPHHVVDKLPIREVAAILSAMNLVVSNDTGIMHVASAAGAPVLSLFGPTDPEQWAPKDGMSKYVYGKTGEMDSISVEEVVIVGREMLRNSRP